MIKVCDTRCVRHHSSLLHFTLGLFGLCHNKSHNGQAGIAGYSCQGYRCPVGPTSLLIQPLPPERCCPHPVRRRLQAAAEGKEQEESSSSSSWVMILGSCRRTCDLHHLLHMIFLPLSRREKQHTHKKTQTNKKTPPQKTPYSNIRQGQRKKRCMENTELVTSKYLNVGLIVKIAA